MLCRATQDGWVMVESSDKMWSTGEGNSKPLQYSCLKKKRSERQRRKGKIHPSECRVPRIARRDKKAFLSDQCEEIEENNKWGKTRDVFKKIRDIKRIFHVNMGTKKDRNGVDLTETDMQMTPPLW